MFGGFSRPAHMPIISVRTRVAYIFKDIYNKPNLVYFKHLFQPAPYIITLY